MFNQHYEIFYVKIMYIVYKNRWLCRWLRRWLVELLLKVEFENACNKWYSSTVIL